MTDFTASEETVLGADNFVPASRGLAPATEVAVLADVRLSTAARYEICRALLFLLLHLQRNRMLVRVPCAAVTVSLTLLSL